MTNNMHTNYQRIAQAIDYINTHFQQQPSLPEIASVVGLSPYHFQRVFTHWAGVSPKNFIQYLSLQYAKNLLIKSHFSLLDTALETGLSGTSRLHDLFVKIEGMTPGEYKKGGQHLKIRYQFADSPFGSILVASTSKGICRMVFEDNQNKALVELKSEFPNAHIDNEPDIYQHQALQIFKQDWHKLEQIKLHLYATPFQLKVWESLLRIPPGNVTTYGDVAQYLHKPNAARAVGTAIGKNPVAFLIPCHRVIQASGRLGGYRWGLTRKAAIIGWEALN